MKKFVNLALLIVVPIGAAHAADPLEEAMTNGDYATAEKLASTLLEKDKHSADALSSLGDARFLGGSPDAHQSYTRAWLEDLERAWDTTKGDSPFWKFLAASVAVLGAATDYTNAKQGVSSSYTAKGIETSSEMMSTLEEATGNKDARKEVKRVMKDLKALTKRESSTYRVIRPSWYQVAGAGMARVHLPSGVCNGVRIRARTYVASSECITRFGAPTGVSIGTTLRPAEFSKVAAITGNGDLTYIEVEDSESDVATMEWKPLYGTSPNQAPTGYGATWFAPEFSYVIPVFQECGSEQYDDCGAVFENAALLWIRYGNEWRFYGFASTSGTVARLMDGN